MPPDQPLPPHADPLFHPDGPIAPRFVTEAVRTVLRSLPIDATEPAGWANRRMACALDGLAALRPRDETELLYAVQALCAYHAAAYHWHLGVNLIGPPGAGIRHTAMAASAARTFDAMTKSLERRQARPLAPPPPRAEPRSHPETDARAEIKYWEDRARTGEIDPADEPGPEPVWTPEGLALADAILDHNRFMYENHGLDLANTPGILPGGGMVVPAEPTEIETAYLARRYCLALKREYRENKAAGRDIKPYLWPIRTGSVMP